MSWFKIRLQIITVILPLIGLTPGGGTGLQTFRVLDNDEFNPSIMTNGATAM